MAAPGERPSDKFVRAVEGAAAAFLAVITLLTFVSVFMRYVFVRPIPDGFDIARLLLGVTIFWGIASTTYRNDHIMVDLLWEMAGPKGKRTIDLFATTVTAGAIAVFAWVLVGKVQDTLTSNQTTFDLHLPVWVFHALASLGILAAAALGLLRLWRLVRGADDGSAST